jgi:L-seryl-tRNA(Ser) seleniumtransferase
VEVGTTNRTRVQDYASAIASDAEVVAVLRVHPSNFRIEGFTARPAAADLARVAHDAGVTMVHDVGSGVLHDDLPVPSSVEPEPSLRTALTDGADVVVASGDKLLGGPQAGLLAGATRVVDACRTHPLARALRVDKLRLAALEATLDAYRRDDVAGLPTWAALSAPVAVLRARAGALVASAAEAGVGAEIVDLEGVVGGGTLPGTTLPSAGIALDGHPDDLAARLGRADPPVVGRVHDGRLVLDLRTVPPDRDDDLQAVLARLAG